MTNIILCGGNGTRLWPISRVLMPKQFVKLFNDRSLFQLTAKRNKEVCDSQLIVSNTQQYFLAVDQLEEIKEKNARYLLEPVAKNTAPAIALACLGLQKDTIVLVTPSDHLIHNQQRYNEIAMRAKEFAKKGSIVTCGIQPTVAHTGYGYIQSKGEDVVSFHEKPDLNTAQRYLKDGDYYWNSGIFCFKVEVFLSELQKYAPKIYKQSLVAYENAKKSDQIVRLKDEDMEMISEDSIDYAVMEKSKIVKVIKSDFGWSDVGSFDSLYEDLQKDNHGNTKSSQHIGLDSKNNLIYSENKKVATVDIEDLIIVDTVDALLVAKKGSSQKIKTIVKKLKENNSQLHYEHKTVHRAWGNYTVLEDSEGYKIKKIVVKPGCRLSLQKHFHRNEHWVVLSGTATVRVGDSIKAVKTNESTYIKMGELHRLENHEKVEVVLIEVQVGTYTGEDDIIRVEDDYERLED